MAIYKHDRVSELGNTTNKFSKWLERDSNQGPADCENNAMGTWPRCLHRVQSSIIDLDLFIGFDFVIFDKYTNTERNVPNSAHETTTGRPTLVMSIATIIIYHYQF